MLKTLNDHFNEQNGLKLDGDSKARLFSKIYKNTHKSVGLSRALMMRSKVLSVFLLIAFSFSIVQYLYLPNQNILSVFSRLRSANIASADYIATVVSWDGTYKINLKNGGVFTHEGNRTISDGSELIVEKGSKVSIKTSNQAQADVVGPAKIAFNKKDNQIIVDVKYSEQIDIKQDKLEGQNTNKLSNIEPNADVNVVPTRDVLVVKTKNQTIVGKQGDSMHIALAHETKTDSDVITNKDGDIVITNVATNTSIELKANQVAALLDAEVKLFADVIVKEDDNTPLLAMDKINKPQDESVSNTQSVDIQSDIKDLLGSSKDGEKSTSYEDNTNNTDVLKIATARESIDVSQDASISQSTMSLLSDPIVSDDEKTALDVDSKQNNDTVSQSMELSAKADILLGSKKVLRPTVVGLLDKLYVNYQLDSNIANYKDIIFQLCDELHISCKKGSTAEVFMEDLHTINNKIKSSYIVTSAIKLVW